MFAIIPTNKYHDMGESIPMQTHQTKKRQADGLLEYLQGRYVTICGSK